MSLTKKQAEYLRNCSHRYGAKIGAVGSGKSYGDILATIPLRVTRARGDGLLVLLGNTRGTLERNILEPMREVWGEELVSPVSANNTVMLFGQRCYVLGADNSKHVARIQGMTVEWAYGDEVSTWNENVFRMLQSRLRTPGACMDLTSNPDSPGHWLKKFLDSPADIYLQTYNIDDGVMPAETIEALKLEYSGSMFYNRYILGEWCNAEGLVYPMFSAQLHCFSEPPARKAETEYYISLDYGTQNPTAAGLWQVQDGAAWMIAEYYHDGRKSGQKTDEEYLDDLIKWAAGYPVRRLIIDPSAASFRAAVRKRRAFHTLDADNSVIDGIRFTASLLNLGRLHIHQNCRNTIEEFGLYRWDDEKPQDSVIKEYDHAMDAIRYLCQTLRYKFGRREYTPLYMNRLR